MNPLLTLRQSGQSVWLDHISRGLITDGTLQRRIDDDGLAGMTSNPTIFDKAIAGGGDYDAGLRRALESDSNAVNCALSIVSSSGTFNWRPTCSGPCIATAVG